MRKKQRSRVALAAVLTLAVAVIGGAPPAAAASSKAAPFAGPGQYAAGVTTLDLGDRKVEVWYPADKRVVRGRKKDVYFVRDSLPAALQRILPPDVNPPFEQDAYREVAASKKGPFPLVLFSHGFAGYRDQSTFLTTHLATWGFVVASPDFLERNLGSVLGVKPPAPKTDTEVLRSAVDRMRTESRRKGGPLAGRVKKGKVAVTGHSGGGFSAIEFGSEPDVVGYIPLSASGEERPGASALTAPGKPSMYLVGGADRVVGTQRVKAYYTRAVPAPKRLVIIAGAGHTGPTDACDIGTAGGLVATARAAGLPIPASFDQLYDCSNVPLRAHDSWPVFDHFVTAQLRAWFRLDKKPVGLGNGAAGAFPPVEVSYEHTP